MSRSTWEQDSSWGTVDPLHSIAKIVQGKERDDRPANPDAQNIQTSAQRDVWTSSQRLCPGTVAKSSRASLKVVVGLAVCGEETELFLSLCKKTSIKIYR